LNNIGIDCTFATFPCSFDLRNTFLRKSKQTNFRKMQKKQKLVFNQKTLLFESVQRKPFYKNINSTALPLLYWDYCIST
jgi:hypothetical protein